MSYPDAPPKSDLPEVLYRLSKVMKMLEEINDDFTRNEIYERVEYVNDIIRDVRLDLFAIDRVLRAVTDS
jgi:hypothetical protein